LAPKDRAAREVMRALYRPLYLIETPIVVQRRSRTPSSSNTPPNIFLATTIAFIRIAELC